MCKAVYESSLAQSKPTCMGRRGAQNCRLCCSTQLQCQRAIGKAAQALTSPSASVLALWFTPWQVLPAGTWLISGDKGQREKWVTFSSHRANLGDVRALDGRSRGWQSWIGFILTQITGLCYYLLKDLLLLVSCPVSVTSALSIDKRRGDALQKEIQPILKSEPSSQCVETRVLLLFILGLEI